MYESKTRKYTQPLLVKLLIAVYFYSELMEEMGHKNKHKTSKQATINDGEIFVGLYRLTGLSDCNLLLSLIKLTGPVPTAVCVSLKRFLQ